MKNNFSSSIAHHTLKWAEAKKIPTWYQPITESTNLSAKEDLVDSEFASLYLTKHQTAGRGRGQNSWVDLAQGGQLFSSWVFQISHPPQPILAPLLGLSLHKTLCQHWHSIFALKAPNDIYIENQKIAGILIENIQSAPDQHRLVIGLGLNVTSKPNLSTAGCLSDSVSLTSLEGEWPDFLTDLFFEWGSMACLERDHLLDSERQELLNALNKFSLLPEPYLDIHPDGSLQTKSKLIHWSEL